MWTQATLEHRRAIEKHVVWRDCPRNHFRCVANELHALPCGHVLDHHSQVGKAVDDRCQYLVDEHRFAIECIHRRIGGLGMHQ